MKNEKENKQSKQPYLKLNEKHDKKAMSNFQRNIMIKIGFWQCITILVVGIMNNLIVFFSFGHIKQVSQAIFLDNELLALTSLNNQQAKTVSNQVQMIVTALHQLNKVNIRQINQTPQSSSFMHCYPQSYYNYVKTTQNLNCKCTPPSNCQYSPFLNNPNIIICPNTNINSPYPWYENNFSSSYSQNQYYYFAATTPNSDPIFSQQAYNQVRVDMQYQFQEFYTIARLQYKSMKNFIDYIKITHQSGVEMFYSGQPASFYQCDYSTRNDKLFQKARQYSKLYSKDLVEFVYIDQATNVANEKIKSVFCLVLTNMINCVTQAADVQCGQICIQSSIAYSQIQKILSKNIIVDSQQYFLIGSQELDNYQVINQQVKNSQGVLTSFAWLYTVLFNYLPTQPVSQLVVDFSNKFGQYFYPYSPSISRAEYEIQDMGFGEYYQSQTDTVSFAWSYIKVDQDYEDPNTDKIVFTLMSQFNQDDAMEVFSSYFDKESKLNSSWIWVALVTVGSMILCYCFLKQFASSIANPIIELTQKVKQIREGNLDINLLVDFKFSFEELNNLYEELEDVNLQIKYSTDNFYNEKSDAENLINLTNAICLYQNLKNQKILGILYNNLGNIYARNQKYTEAISCFRKAVKIAEKELRKLVRFDYPEVFYKAKRISGWEEFLKSKEPPSPLGWLEEEEKAIYFNNKKMVRVNSKLKKKLEEVYCNRLFSLANVLIFQGEIEQQNKDKLLYFEEAIDHLNLVEKVDKNLDHARSRSIKIHFKLSQAYINRAKLVPQFEEDLFEGIESCDRAQSKFPYYEVVHNLFRVEILKRKMEKDLNDDNVSIRKSTNQYSSINQTQKINLLTQDSLQKHSNRRNNPMLIEMSQFYSPVLKESQYNRIKKIPSMIQAQQRQLNDEETDLEVIVDDPPEILKSELGLVKGQVYYEIGLYDIALEQCTKAIEGGKYFNPDIRRECLKIIQNIFELQIKKKQKNLEKEQKDGQEYTAQDKIIQDFQKALKVVNHMIQDCEVKGKKDVVFLMDISETMCQSKYKAIDSFVSIRENYIKQFDRLALISFNHNVNVCFELQVSGKNDKFIDKYFKDAKNLACTGDKALYNAIYDGIKLFKKTEPQPNSRWLVAITDNVDNYSRIDEEQLKPLFFQNNVKLILIGLNLKSNAKEVYLKLCKNTGGTFIENPDSMDLNVAFQSITNLQFATYQQANYVDEKFD
ncbi:tetratricopeptide repeat protein (macronuclear) [Tetrahymena thermophila SB210]|uniref:Tetratricopeptide repeat protein n=1 Tax=Tetrahymena thermophila (strain SB210) TaxID=312017 RepID=Q23RC3_TETTS|nr:tetratricopeptide repeat protein [Tetrahymena thermophila SB210]EAR99125.1 tetratricopeptide repeat protein [Tetrahymena thermophila SB210]|eukprot:XP_001019370.1 tetratricopeptide repeat protein [Tetrahymena thermophila SB210]